MPIRIVISPVSVEASARAERRPHIGRFAGAHRKARGEFRVGADGERHDGAGKRNDHGAYLPAWPATAPIST